MKTWNTTFPTRLLLCTLALTMACAALPTAVSAVEAKPRLVVMTVPTNASSRTIHVILEATDAGQPPLVGYRRVVLKVSGEPVPPPPGARGVAAKVLPPPTKQ